MSKSKIERLIDSFEPFEVAFLLKYRLSVFMKPTQTKITEYAANNLVHINDIEKLMEERLSKNETLTSNQCPRCTSDKYFAHNIEVDDVSSANQMDSMVGNGKVLTVEKRSCIVCGLDHDNRTKWSWKQFFRFM